MFGEKNSGFARIANEIKSSGSHCSPNDQVFAGCLVKVIECNKEGDCLCLNENEHGSGMASIDHSDVLLFIPIEKDSSNFLMPSGLGLIQQMNWTAMAHQFPDIFNAAIISFASKNDRIPTHADFKEVYKLCDKPDVETSQMAHLILITKAAKMYGNA
jgi:hypothetical protein